MYTWSIIIQITIITHYVSLPTCIYLSEWMTEFLSVWKGTLLFLFSVCCVLCTGACVNMFGLDDLTRKASEWFDVLSIVELNWLLLLVSACLSSTSDFFSSIFLPFSLNDKNEVGWLKTKQKKSWDWIRNVRARERKNKIGWHRAEFYNLYIYILFLFFFFEPLIIDFWRAKEIFVLHKTKQKDKRLAHTHG